MNEAIKKKSNQTSINYGIIFGLILIIELIIGYVFNIDGSNGFYGVIINVLNFFLLPFIFIYISANYFKNKINDGFISISETIKTGVIVGVIASLTYGVFYFIFDLIIPEFKEELFEKTLEISKDKFKNMSSEQVKMSVDMMKMALKPIFAIPVTILMNSFISIIHSLIVAAIIKKPRPIFE